MKNILQKIKKYLSIMLNITIYTTLIGSLLIIWIASFNF